MMKQKKVISKVESKVKNDDFYKKGAQIRVHGSEAVNYSYDEVQGYNSGSIAVTGEHIVVAKPVSEHHIYAKADRITNRTKSNKIWILQRTSYSFATSESLARSSSENLNVQNGEYDLPTSVSIWELERTVTNRFPETGDLKEGE